MKYLPLDIYRSFITLHHIFIITKHKNLCGLGASWTPLLENLLVSLHYRVAGSNPIDTPILTNESTVMLFIKIMQKHFFQVTSTLLTQDGGLTLNHNFYLKAERLPLLFHEFGVLLDEDTTKPIASNISNIDC